MADVRLVYNTGVDAYNFTPVPFFNITKNYQKTGDGTPIGSVFNATLDGNLVSSPTGGLALIDSLQDQLVAALATEGKLLRLTCDGQQLLAVYPRINSLNLAPSSNNWIFTSPYTIDIEWDGESGIPPFISEASEEWNIEFLEERSKYQLNLTTGLDTNPYQLRLSHTVSAKGKRYYDAGGLSKPAWQQARDYVIPLLGYDSTKVGSSGVLNLNSALFAPYNHIRTEQINELGGDYSVSENWIVINPSGTGIAGRALEDFTVSVRASPASDGLTSVSVDGTIHGLESRDYGTNPTGFNITETKYEAAVAYWANVKPRVYPRAVNISTPDLTRALNTSPVTWSVAHNPPLGEITYSYEFNDRPSNCITGALSEIFVITDTNPTDLFASLLVLGRSAGPVLQDLGTVTSYKRQVDIEVVMQPPTGCPSSIAAVTAMINSSPKGQINSLMTNFENELKSAYAQVFRSQDTFRWEPKSGHASATVEWTLGNCP